MKLSTIISCYSFNFGALYYNIELRILVIGPTKIIRLQHEQGCGHCLKTKYDNNKTT